MREYPVYESETEGRLVPVASRLAGLVVALVLTASLVWACIKQGPTFSEFQVWFQARPDRTLTQSFYQGWLPQGSPPLFYLLAWGARQLTDKIEWLRFINLAALALSLGGALVLMRGRQYMALGVAFLMAMVTNQCAVVDGASLNPAFVMLCAA